MLKGRVTDFEAQKQDTPLGNHDSGLTVLIHPPTFENRHQFLPTMSVCRYHVEFWKTGGCIRTSKLVFLLPNWISLKNSKSVSPPFKGYYTFILNDS